MRTWSVCSMAGQAVARRAMLNVAIGGSAANEASEVAVKPAGRPSGWRAVITETPAASRRNASLNADTSSVIGGSESTSRLCHH